MSSSASRMVAVLDRLRAMMVLSNNEGALDSRTEEARRDFIVSLAEFLGSPLDEVATVARCPSGNVVGVIREQPLPGPCFCAMCSAKREGRTA